MNMKKIYIVAGVLVLGLFLCYRATTLSRFQKNGNDKSAEIGFSSDEELTRECTYDHVTFRVGSAWEEQDGRDATYIHTDGASAYMILGTSQLGAEYDADAFYSALLYLYKKEGNVIDKKGGASMQPYVTANGIEGYIGRISMNKNVDGKYDAHLDVDVLVLPTKNYAVTFAAQCNAEHALPLDIRKMVDTAEIDIAMDDVTKGATFYDEHSDSLLDLTDGERFVNYLSSENKEMYADGTYKVYRGEDAIQKVASMTEYGLTREELEKTVNSAYSGYALNGSDPISAMEGAYFVCKDDFYAIVFSLESFHDEIGNVSDSNKQEALYIGYYVEELDMLDMMNCKSMSFYRWKRQKQ